MNLHRRGEICIYCGEPATSTDHVPPRVARNTGLLDPSTFYEVPACHDCNCNCLGKNGPYDLEGRRTYVRARLIKRFEWLIGSGAWTEQELETLGLELRRRIQKSLHLRETILRRLRYLSQPVDRSLLHQTAVKPPRKVITTPVIENRTPASRTYFGRAKTHDVKTGLSEIEKLKKRLAFLESQSKFWTEKCEGWTQQLDSNPSLRSRIEKYHKNEASRQAEIKKLHGEIPEVLRSPAKPTVPRKPKKV